MMKLHTLALFAVLLLSGLSFADVNASGTYASCSGTINASSVTCLTTGCVNILPGHSNINLYGVSCAGAITGSQLSNIRIINGTMEGANFGTETISLTDSSNVYIEGITIQPSSFCPGVHKIYLHGITGTCELNNVENQYCIDHPGGSTYFTDPDTIIDNADNCYIHGSTFDRYLSITNSNVIRLADISSDFLSHTHSNVDSVTSLTLEGAIAGGQIKTNITNVHIKSNSAGSIEINTGFVDTQTVNQNWTLALNGVVSQSIHNVAGSLTMSESSGNTFANNNFTNVAVASNSGANTFTSNSISNLTLAGQSSWNIFTNNLHDGGVTITNQSNNNQIVSTASSVLGVCGTSYPYPVIGFAITNSAGTSINTNGASTGCVDISSSTSTSISNTIINCRTCAIGVGRTSTITNTNSVALSNSTINGVVMSNSNSSDFSTVNLSGSLTMTDSNLNAFGANSNISGISLTRSNRNTWTNVSNTGALTVSLSDYNNIIVDRTGAVSLVNSNYNNVTGINITKAQIYTSSLSLASSAWNSITGLSFTGGCGSGGTAGIRQPAVTFSTLSSGNYFGRNVVDNPACAWHYPLSGQPWLMILDVSSINNVIEENMFIDPTDLVDRYFYDYGANGSNTLQGNGYGIILRDPARNISGVVESLWWQNWSYSGSSRYYFAGFGPDAKRVVSPANYPTTVFNETDFYPLTPNTTSNGSVNVTILYPPDALTPELMSLYIPVTYLMEGGMNLRNCWLAVNKSGERFYTIQMTVPCANNTTVGISLDSGGIYAVMVGAFDDTGAGWDINTFRMSSSATPPACAAGLIMCGGVCAATCPTSCPLGTMLCGDGICRASCEGGTTWGCSPERPDQCWIIGQNTTTQYDACASGFTQYGQNKSYLERYIVCNFARVVGNAEWGGAMLALIVLMVFLAFVMMQNTRLDGKLAVMIPVVILVSVWMGWVMWIAMFVVGAIIALGLIRLIYK